MKKVKHILAIGSAPEETNFDDLGPILHILFSINLYTISINLITNNNCDGCVCRSQLLSTQNSYKNHSKIVCYVMYT